MTGFVLRTLVTSLALWVTALVLPGIALGESTSGTDRIFTVVLVACLFGLLNSLVKPILQLFGFPLIVLSLGLFLVVINALMLMLTSWVATRFGLDFSVAGFGSALIGAVMVSLVSWALGLITGTRS
ncbi:phage holin family protein [Gephyromycinifex aptenodytis]|uniref:phage holin family protein n=1 Tax=Gephyromycinifex aptenodytis TaxID=2716227 RepID=UPI001445732E|nr:phage holin family protein [Gephyromycinifex aptenodytis]